MESVSGDQCRFSRPALTGQRRRLAFGTDFPRQTVANARSLDIGAADDDLACRLLPGRRSVLRWRVTRRRDIWRRRPLGEWRQICLVLDKPDLARRIPPGPQFLGLVLFRERNLQICSHGMPGSAVKGAHYREIGSQKA